MTFRRWLEDQEERDDLVGDLARDARLPFERRGPAWPRGLHVPTPGGLIRAHRHLSSHFACPQAHEALNSAWQEWSNSLR